MLNYLGTSRFVVDELWWFDCGCGRTCWQYAFQRELRIFECSEWPETPFQASLELESSQVCVFGQSFEPFTSSLMSYAGNIISYFWTVFSLPMGVWLRRLERKVHSLVINKGVLVFSSVCTIFVTSLLLLTTASDSSRVHCSGQSDCYSTSVFPYDENTILKDFDSVSNIRYVERSDWDDGDHSIAS